MRLRDYAFIFVPVIFMLGVGVTAVVAEPDHGGNNGVFESYINGFGNTLGSVILDGTDQLFLPLIASQTTPGLAFGDGDTGLTEFADDSLIFTNAGAYSWQITASVLGDNNSSGPAILNETATTTNPTLVPYQGDIDTGVGASGANVLSLIAGGSSALLVTHNGAVAGVDIVDGGAKPTCAVGVRGWLWMDEGATSVADTVEVCTKDGSDVYAWRALF